MPEPSIKRRLRRARRLAEKKLEDLGYVVPAENARLVVAFRKNEIRVVLLSLDDVNPADIGTLEAIPAPPACAKEAWTRRTGDQVFLIERL